MGEAISIFLIFGAVITITAIVFGGWLIVSIIRLLARGFSYALGGDDARARADARGPLVQSPRLPPHPVVCPNPQCRAGNRVEARFCRRCGAVMPPPHQVQVRRAAVW